MKRSALITLMWLLGMSPLFGQAFKLGILAGPNLSTFTDIDGPPEETSSAIIGVHAGLFTDIKLGRFWLEPGLFYESVGGSSNFASGPPDGGSANYTYTVQYLQLPFNLLYNPKGSKFFFGGGPYIAWGLSAHLSGSAGGGAFDGGFTQNINQTFTLRAGDNPDCGLNVIAGVRLEGGTLLGLGFAKGLKYLFYSEDFNSNNSTMRNNVISISLGHRIF